MKSLKELLIVGPGPSSSHTIGPYRISLDFLSRLNKTKINKIEVTLFGSLALTGKGHATDNIIKKTFKDYNCIVNFDLSLKDLKHPNTMNLKAYLNDDSIYEKTYYSIGGGSFIVEGEDIKKNDVYPFSTFDGLKEYIKKNNVDDIYSIIKKFEDVDIFSYAKNLLLISFKTIEDSLNTTGILEGPLKLKRVAKDIFNQAKLTKDNVERRMMYLTSYAYATAEANADNKLIVTTPTCGAAGVVPAVLYYEYKNKHKSLDSLVKSYLVGALICNFIKENAAVAGALLGCQSEIGSASSFAAASLSYLNGLSLKQIEYASEVAMEHFLGLTCDPVDGYVQIPCIERNGIAAIHSYASFLYAKNISLHRNNVVSFDNVILAMKETGNELPSDLKETSLGGLAKIILC